MEDQVDSTCVVDDIEPVTHILALSIDGQRLTMTDIVDEEGDQLLWELIGTIVIRAVGHQCRHPIGIVVRTDKVVAGSLTR